MLQMCHIIHCLAKHELHSFNPGKCKWSLVNDPVSVREIDWLVFDWLVFYGTSTQYRSICAYLPGGLLAQAFEDSQRITYKNIQLHAIQWTYTCNEKQQVCLTCLKINNASERPNGCQGEYIFTLSSSILPTRKQIRPFDAHFHFDEFTSRVMLMFFAIVIS